MMHSLISHYVMGTLSPARIANYQGDFMPTNQGIGDCAFARITKTQVRQQDMAWHKRLTNEALLRGGSRNGSGSHQRRSGRFKGRRWRGGQWRGDCGGGNLFGIVYGGGAHGGIVLMVAVMNEEMPRQSLCAESAPVAVQRLPHAKD